ncbi:LytTR family DNA-binding domain-containing protein [Pollutibacter soli]|uniref:LytR/AlgR family response regulator transcription factor n=1 Tax=Pollutibacter soli TaxID=3034157 RepID=UPI0030137405
MTRAVIIDDETHSIETLKWKLENYCPDVTVIASFTDPAEGVRFLKQNEIDILFLDIEMPMLNGFDVLEEVGQSITFDVIFITAYDNFGIQAVKFSALDYLLKPVQNKELKEAIEKHLRKAQPNIPNRQLEVLMENVHAEKRGKTGKIALASRDIIEFVNPEEIIVCTSNSNYTEVYLSDGRKKVISKTLKEFEDMLVPFHFFRPHHSHLINLSEVKEFIRGDGGFLVMKNKMKIPVSKSKKDELMSQLL